MSPEQRTTRELAKASGSMGVYLDELGRTDVDVLDFGCGWGGETIWLAERVRRVTGVDIDASHLDQARTAQKAYRSTNCRFELGTTDIASASVDAVFSTDTFEHVQDLPGTFAELFRVLKPGGHLIAQWGPLFHSPYGYHLSWATRVPYAHLLCGLDAILAVRNARAPEPFHARTWTEMGLNRRTYRDYRRAAENSGFELTRFRRMPVRNLTALATLPFVGRLFTFGIDAHLVKPAHPRR
jgi:SAM-dependent methyltransferase